ncbi:MAG: site-specific integrase, partial [Rectinemataceae bacterium]|nr:site-specific integrase [Rectinemataceae bacterium]
TMTKRKTRNPIRLIKVALEELQPESSAYFVSVVNAKEQAIRGLNVRVLPSGIKIFVHRYRYRGFQKSITLGRFPSMSPEIAEKASRAAQSKIDAGIDPGQAKAEARVAEAEKRKAAFTVRDLANEYLEKHTVNNSIGWQKESTRLIQNFIIPTLGNLPVVDVGTGDVSSLLSKIAKVTPTQSNRVRAVLGSMFRFAEVEQYRPLGSNPVPVVQRKATETKRERRLNDMELKALGVALQESTEDPAYILALRLAILAGMRKGEIQGLRWEWFDPEEATIVIPAKLGDGRAGHKTGKKTGKARVVHLCDALVAEIKVTQKVVGCPYMIPGKPKVVDGRVMWTPFTALQNPWERIRVTAKLAIKDEPRDEDPGLHDLRRTFASVGADLGLKGFVGELLGHAEVSVTDVYTRAGAERLHDAAEAIGARINGILSGDIDPEKELKERRKAQAEKRGAS